MFFVILVSHLSTMRTFVLLLALSAGLPAATITGATLFSATSGGNTLLLPEIWNTQGGDLIFNLYLRQGGTAINTGNGANASVNISLATPGTYVFGFRAQPGLLDPNQFGLNLFFNGNSSTPGISALVTAGGSTFGPNGATFTHQLDGSLVSGANSLVFVDGPMSITMTALSQARAGGNTVGAYTSTPGLIGGNDYTGSFTLVVTPEPSSYLLFGAGMAGLAMWRRRMTR
jgi:hypothetical protein